MMNAVNEKTDLKSSKDPGKKLGTCVVCGNNPAVVECSQCHEYVCRDCYFTLVGICQKCVSKPTAKKWKQKKVDWEKKLGVEWID